MPATKRRHHGPLVVELRDDFFGERRGFNYRFWRRPADDVRVPRIRVARNEIDPGSLIEAG
jgi:hypothetical protein